LAIQSFADKETEEFFKSGSLRKSAGWSSLAMIVARKLDMLHYSASLQDLRSPPGNQLEKLRGNLREMHSIRINDQWRIIFRWTEAGPVDVRIIDYHK
jgi:proteic killer suppression protein